MSQGTVLQSVNQVQMSHSVKKGVRIETLVPVYRNRVYILFAKVEGFQVVSIGRDHVTGKEGAKVPIAPCKSVEEGINLVDKLAEEMVA